MHLKGHNFAHQGKGFGGLGQLSLRMSGKLTQELLMTTS